jgi:hypothetical protein
MLPQPLIEEYWDRVRRILQNDYQLDSSQSQETVDRYRKEVEPRAGEMVYHQDAKEVAEALSHFVKQCGTKG